jgi:glycosyltransferase involved in cell wall biosynthesis
MRLLIYHNILWPKHIGAVFSSLYSLGSKRGISVRIVHLAETEVMRADLSTVDRSYHVYPYRVLFLGSYEAVGTARMAFALAKDILTHPSDVVILPGYERAEYWVLLALCVLLRRTRLVFVDSTALDRPKTAWKELAKKLFFARCDGFLCYGSRSRSYVAGYGVSADKTFGGCQATALAHGYDATDIQRAYDEAGSNWIHGSRFVFIGRLATEKGLYDLVKAFKAVYDQNPLARLDLIGAGSLRDALVLQIARLGLSDAVTLCGTRDISEFASIFARSVALVLPSYSEPWGLVVNEALSYGCPVVVSDRCGCVPELVIDGVSGFVFEAGNVAALSAAMSAATRLSEDRPATVRRCLELMARFTPDSAGENILQGCMTTMDGSSSALTLRG